jgi:hypothetical protein
LIEHEASNGYIPLTPSEVYRVNRIRLANQFKIDPPLVDKWDTQTYYDALEVIAGDNELAKLK